MSAALGGIRLVLGGNAFGWTADAATSARVLDAFVDGGGRMVDTAEEYSNWVPGHVGGESETVIGNWLAKRRDREALRIHTKVGMSGKPGCLAPSVIERAIDGSLKRLRTDYVDLYYAHKDDPETPQEAVLETFARLVEAGKVRTLGASNFSADRLASALRLSEANDWPRYEVLQPMYNLVERRAFEGPLQDLCVREGVAALPYWGLAVGFLTGKFRHKEDLGRGARGAFGVKYLDGNGPRVLAALDAIAAEVGAIQGQIALAWLNAQPGISAPIAGARNLEQVTELLGAAAVTLSPTQLMQLEKASR